MGTHLLERTPGRLLLAGPVAVGPVRFAVGGDLKGAGALLPRWDLHRAGVHIVRWLLVTFIHHPQMVYETVMTSDAVPHACGLSGDEELLATGDDRHFEFVEHGDVVWSRDW